MTQEQKRDEKGKFGKKRNRKPGLIFIAVLAAIGGIYAATQDAANMQVQASTVATTTQPVGDQDIEKQVAIFKDGKILEKEKVQLDTEYKKKSEEIEKKLEQNRKDQLSFR